METYENNITTVSTKDNKIKIDDKSFKIHYFIFCVLIVIWFICSRLEENIWNMKSILSIFYTFIENWNAYPIIDIVSTNKSVCPLGYDILINDKFPGFKKGCYCNNTGELFLDSCKDIDGFELSCQGISEIKKEKYKIYRKSILCGKRTLNDYFKLLKENLVRRRDCEAGYKNCGIIDSKNYKLCLPENENCPINMIHFIDENDNFMSNYDFNFTKINLDQNKTLIFTRDNIKGKILIEFKIEDGPPCADPLFTNSQTNFTKFKLHPKFSQDQCSPLQSDLNYDERYEELDRYSYDLILEQNHIKDKLITISALNYQNTIINQTSLFSRNYINFDKQCLINLNEKIKYYYGENNNFNEDFLDLTMNELINLISKFNLLCIILFIFTFIEVMYYMVLTKYMEDLDDIPKNWLGKIISEGFNCFFILFLIIILIISMKKSFSLKTVFNIQGCSDQYNEIHFSKLKSYFYNFYLECLLLFIILIICFGGIVFSLVKFSHNLENDEKIEDNDKKMLELNKIE